MATPHDQDDLEKELARLYYEGGRDLHYWANRFYQLFTPHCKRYKGGIAAVHSMLKRGSRAPGLEILKKANRLDLSLEQLVLSPEWTHLFQDEDRGQARRNLA
ncbi:MAG TPA: hypothetical protein VMU80_15755 [Bryobacteraceae bacterium]|nr:hypothetical protein [Bryobacteraceae bacterium]